jgi:hypothetical protein
MSIQKNTPHILKAYKLPFTTIFNGIITAIKDAAALGIYCYLASKPDDWEISEAHLMNQFEKGRDFIRGKLRYLRKVGALKKEAIRGEDGTIVRWETTLVSYIHNQETENPSSSEHIQMTENPVSGKSRRLENPPTTNKRYKQIKDTNKTPIVPTGNEPLDTTTNKAPNGGLREEKGGSLTIEQMLNDNPHHIPATHLEEWQQNRRKKPITARVWRKTNEVMGMVAGKGITPLEAFETMLEKLWLGLEYRYFEKEIEFRQGKAKQSNTKKSTYSLADVLGA